MYVIKGYFINGSMLVFWINEGEKEDCLSRTVVKKNATKYRSKSNAEKQIEKIHMRCKKCGRNDYTLQIVKIKKNDKITNNKTHTYYLISNTMFDGSFQGNWSEDWNDTDLTDIDEAKELFKKAQREWSNNTFKVYKTDRVCLRLDEYIVPINRNGNFIFLKQDADVIDWVIISIL